MAFAGKTHVTVLGIDGNDTTTLDTTMPADGLSDLTIDTGLGNVTVNVQATPVPTTIISDGGHAAVNVGDGGSLAAVLAPLNLPTTGGFMSLSVDDTADTAARTFTVSASGITGLSPQPINYDPNTLNGMTISAGSGGNSITVNGLPDVANPVNLNTGAGDDSVSVYATSQASALHVNTQEGNNTMTVGWAGDLQSVQGLVDVSSTGGSCNLTIDGQADSNPQTVLLTSTDEVGLGGTDVHFTDLSLLTVADGNGGNIFNDVATPNAPEAIFCGAGSDTVNLQSSGGTVAIVGGSGSDVVNIAKQAQAATQFGSSVNVSGSPHSIALTIADNGDIYGRNPVITTTDVTGLIPGCDIHYDGSSLHSLTVQTSDGVNKITVAGTNPNVSTEVDGGASFDTFTVQATDPAGSLVIDGRGFGDNVNIGDNHSVQQVLGPVALKNTGGTLYITLDDAADVTSRNTVLDTFTPAGSSDVWGRVSGLTPGLITYDYPETRDLTLDSGKGLTTVQVTAAANLSLIGNGKLAVTIGSNGSVQGTTHSIDVSDPADSAALTIDDSADTTARNSLMMPFVVFTTTWARMTGLAPAPISFSSDDYATNVVIDSGSGSNSFWVNLPVAHTQFTLNAGRGSDTCKVDQLSAQDVFTFNGGNGLVADYNTGKIDPTSAINFYAVGFFSTLNVNGNPGDAFTLVPGQFSRGTQTLRYTGLAYAGVQTGNYTVTGDLGGLGLLISGPSASAVFQTTEHLRSLFVGASAALTGGGNKTLFLGSLTLGSNAQLDLADNSLQVGYATGSDQPARIRTYIVSGYNGGAWNGAGLITSMGDVNHGLGYANGADGVVAGLSSNTVLVKYARYGDANLDGSVGFDDLVILARNYGSPPGGANWDQGDFNYDGVVSFNDLVKLARDYGRAAAAIRPVAESPAPIAPPRLRHQSRHKEDVRHI